MIPHRAGDADPAGLGQCLQPRGDVDTVAVNVTAFGDHIAEIDPNAEGDPLILGNVGIAVDHRPLHLDGAADRIHNTWKFHEHPVAGGFYDPTVMFCDLRIEQLAADRFEALERAFLIRAHQTRISRDIGSEDRKEAAAGGDCGRVA